MTGVVFALPQELDSLKVRMGPWSRLRAEGFTFYYTRAGRGAAVLVKGGIGRERSRRAAESLLEIFNVDAVISAGLAGGIRDDLRVGDLIIAQNILRCSQSGKYDSISTSYHCHPGLVDLSCKLADEKNLAFCRGDLVTAGEVVAHPSSKRQMGSYTSAVAVDMEGSGVAEAAAACNKPFAAVKVLSDEAGDELRAYNLVDDEGGVKVLSVISYLINNPQDLAYLFRLRSKTNEALGRLAIFLPYLIERIDRI